MQLVLEAAAPRVNCPPTGPRWWGGALGASSRRALRVWVPIEKRHLPGMSGSASDLRRADSERNPNAMRVSSRFLVLVDSISPQPEPDPARLSFSSAAAKRRAWIVDMAVQTRRNTPVPPWGQEPENSYKNAEAGFPPGFRRFGVSCASYPCRVSDASPWCS